MKSFKLFTVAIGIITDLYVCENTFCRFDPSCYMEMDNTINNYVTEISNSFNTFHNSVTQFEENNNISQLEYNYRYEKYLNFRRQLGPISNLTFDLILLSRQQGINAQNAEIFYDYLDEYDIFLMQRQMGNVDVQAPILQ